MQSTFSCPRCQQSARVEWSAGDSRLRCPHCAGEVEIAPETIGQGRLNRCVICHSKDLFVRKDFPQRLGILLVVIAAILSSIAWYQREIIMAFGVLFAAAAIDLVLYLTMGEALECYRCGAQCRGVEDLENHQGFDLEVHERYRQMAARTAERPSSSSSPELSQNDR